ncbi:hypothetical protein [Neisseria weaveri]|uniref:hypothetical protein n=1 Tax=Neisseria weaveri TaxID=28091 RepID=UPI00155E3DE7|nr:hypothetical protein [Neisseria weaveri]
MTFIQHQAHTYFMIINQDEAGFTFDIKPARLSSVHPNQEKHHENESSSGHPRQQR